MSTERKLDDKTRAELLGFVPFSSDCVISFTPEEFKQVKNDDFRPVFEVRSLTQAELDQIKHNTQALSVETSKSPTEKIMDTAEKNLGVIRGCVLGWKRLFDVGTREEIKFVPASSGGCDEKLFQALPVWLRRSILDFVKRISGLSDPEEFSIK